MSTRLTLLRDVFLTGLAWAVAWAPVAVVIGLGIVDPDNSMDEMWFAVGAYPGFLCGVLFRSALAINGHARPATVSLPRAAALGATSGALVGTLPFVLGDSATEMPAWMLASIVIGAITLASGASATITAASARMLARRREVRPAR